MDRVLHVKGLLCPIPVIKTRLAIKEMDVGEVSRLVALP